MKFIAYLVCSLLIACDNATGGPVEPPTIIDYGDRYSGNVEILNTAIGDTLAIEDVVTTLKFKNIDNAVRTDAFTGKVRGQSTKYIELIESIVGDFKSPNNSTVFFTNNGSYHEYEKKLNGTTLGFLRVQSNHRSGYLMWDYRDFKSNVNGVSGTIKFNFLIELSGKITTRLYYTYQDEEGPYIYDAKFTRQSDASGYTEMKYKEGDVEDDFCRQWTSDGFINDCN